MGRRRALAALVVLISGAAGVVQATGGFELTRHTWAGGGILSGAVHLTGSVGQSVAGRSEAADSVLWGGFHAPRVTSWASPWPEATAPHTAASPTGTTAPIAEATFTPPPASERLVLPLIIR